VFAQKPLYSREGSLWRLHDSRLPPMRWRLARTFRCHACYDPIYNMYFILQLDRYLHFTIPIRDDPIRSVSFRFVCRTTTSIVPLKTRGCVLCRLVCGRKQQQQQTPSSTPATGRHDASTSECHPHHHYQSQPQQHHHHPPR
jgi:hypothetical protein